MATLLGAICVSHVPAIGRALAQNLQQDPYWQPFFSGFGPVHEWLAREQPDAAVVLYNDHGLNFFLDNLPTFAVGAAAEYRNEDEGWGIPSLGAFRGSPELSWHLIESLVAEDFDPASCQRMAVDHAFSLPMALLWPDAGVRERIATVPVCINTVQHPLPSPRRCLRLGQAIGRAIASWPGKERVVVLGTGGLSHQLDGTRAGFINRDFDLQCVDWLCNAPEKLAGIGVDELVAKAGSQGVEVMAWLAASGALGAGARRLHFNYHVPISNTASGLLLLEKAA